MSKLKTFYRTLIKSLTDFPYYEEIGKAKFLFSFKYLYFLLFLTSLTSGIVFAVRVAILIPKVPNFITQVKDVAYRSYPSELIVTIDNGKVKTNVKEPYFIDFPEEFGRVGDFKTLHLVTIDTKASVGDYLKYGSVVLVTEDSLVYPDSNNGSRSASTYKVIPLSQGKTGEQKVVIDKAGYDKVVTNLLPYLDYLRPLMWTGILLSLLVLPIVGASLSIAGKMIYLLISSLILLLIVKIMKKAYSYSQIYRMSIHGLTLPILISFVLGIFSVSIPFLYTIVFLVFMIIVFVKMENTKGVDRASGIKGNEAQAQ
ncbi:DUF1189 family protein [Candidatus Woesebacteria bacterium]|nr:DUF1189 family protein [Candidatus Woesebacteria bacterium]